jgi:hypothetical protein
VFERYDFGAEADRKVKDKFEDNRKSEADNLVRDFSCALCVGKQAKIRMTPSHQPRSATRT